MVPGRTAWPAALVTGAAGVIGRVLEAGWRGTLSGFDLPDDDARDLEALTLAARGHEVLVHLAWDGAAENFRNHGFAPANVLMAVNAVEAACAAGVPRLVLASSVHADGFVPVGGTPISTARTPVPDSPYGASKVFVEALGRYAAAHRGVEVVAVRFGGVNPADKEPAEPSERSVWLRHRDCVALVHAAATATLHDEPFALVVGVSDGPHRVHMLDNPLGWRPGAP